MFGRYRFNPNFALELAFVDLGKASYSGTFSGTEDGANLSLGIGANYYFTKNVGARIEWEHFELDPGKASMLSAGIIVKF